MRENLSPPVTLDNAKALKRLDPHGMLELLAGFGEQIRASLRLPGVASLKISGHGIRNILFCGMGGSAIAADLITAWRGDQLSVPLVVNRGYRLPGFAGPETLAIISTYSGNTEETLSAFTEARRVGARIICVSSGGEVARRARQWELDWVQLPPGQPPRTALGYSMVPVALLLSHLGLMSECHEELSDLPDFLERVAARFAPPSPTENNLAKQLATRLRGHLPVIFGSHGRLEAVARRWCGQMCENAKMLAYFSVIPETSHNDIVGWRKQAGQQLRPAAIFLIDREDSSRTALQGRLLRKQLEASAPVVLRVEAEGASWLQRMWYLVLLGDYCSVYLALLNGEDPTTVSPIDQLKVDLLANR